VCFLDSSILSVNHSYYVIVRPMAITGVSYRLNDAWLVPDKLKTTSGYITSTVPVLHSTSPPNTSVIQWVPISPQPLLTSSPLPHRLASLPTRPTCAARLTRIGITKTREEHGTTALSCTAYLRMLQRCGSEHCTSIGRSDSLPTASKRRSARKLDRPKTPYVSCLQV
jgi:hypothetical protein